MFSPLIILSIITLTLIMIGGVEYFRHKQVLGLLPLRIHINGTRGKSSVTRLVAAGLRAGGLKTYAKTTGTAPRVIDPKGRDRIIHRLRSPSIGEQVRLLKYFAQDKPDAVVLECMAVQPQYQWISEQEMVRSHIGVITNVRPDHVDEMGQTLSDIASSLSNTIPRQGVFISGEESVITIFDEVAQKRQTRVVKVNESEIGDDILDQFSYMEHPQNIALALAVCEQAGIERTIALDGMVNVSPDLGALVAWKLDFSDRSVSFINGMAANDPVSTLTIWNYISGRFSWNGESCVFLNTREDRRTRSRQLLSLVMEEIKPDYFIIRGENLEKMVSHLKHYSPNTHVIMIHSQDTVKAVSNAFSNLSDDSLIYAMGNQVGFGQELVDHIKIYRHHG
ncbi:MAG: poly-gamma-glutamate synthase PgsB [Candidatus Marinimicrobia bacterium]|jgi:gamma-polyglutamate synthase|nr:poly-gamma-glutamate synthase PgsB [Candidatus Neomarinimicrobiota bacterium]MBT3829433.1 poly-gamma-glutamate synthase PgsB [Candidatus Neomarinimicrobiota bacterium]MBT4281111.1 poly-gamma-glutamate synthase PgsB [Candidatus Neomarinimicrobiota bacterium]MBT4569303.1 poly-gamma-glutamate synthase PgsB [Candidatus Neomarinimicrobiota bacterium]MBT5339624.1 poly-gamma-glutamate synthase PgsB [Candidatus Neomarinimicrobiota bacterium]